MSDNKHPFNSKLPQKEVLHVNVLRVRRTHWVLCQVLSPLVFLENRNTRRTKSRQNKIPHLPRQHRLLNGVCQWFILGFSGRERAAFLVLKHQCTHAPAHIIALPETDFLSASVLAYSASANATLSRPLPFWSVVPKSLVENT